MSEAAPASEAPDTTAWVARPVAALATRFALLALPMVAGSLAIWTTRRWFVSLDSAETAVRFVQALLVGAVVAFVVDRGVRRISALPTLFGLSLRFPGEAPSRFGLALRLSTVNDVDRYRIEKTERGLDNDTAVAAVEAASLAIVGAAHPRWTSSPAERHTAHADAVATELGVNDDDRNKLTWAVLLRDIDGLSLEPLGEWLGSWRFAAAQRNERWDGAGVPKGIGGERITLAARITSVVDAYAELTGSGASTPDEAKAEILASAGARFDPTTVEAFLAVTPRTQPGPVWRLASVSPPAIVLHGTQAIAVVVAAAIAALSLQSGQDLLALDTAIATNPPTEVVAASDSSDAIDLSETAAARPPTDRREAPTNDLRTTPDPSISVSETPIPTTTNPSSSTTLAPSTELTPSTESTTTAPTTAAPPTTATPTTAPPTTAPPTSNRPTTTIAPITTTPAPTTTKPSGPVAVDDDVTARQGRNKRIDVLANDMPGGSPFAVDTLKITQQPAHGTAEIKGGKFGYRSDADFIGTDTLVYRICDELGACSSAKVTITVD